MSFYRLFSVSTAALRAGPLQFGTELPVRLVGKKSSQGIGLAVTPQDGSIIFSPVTETAIAQWNPKTNEQKCDISPKTYFLLLCRSKALLTLFHFPEYFLMIPINCSLSPT